MVTEWDTKAGAVSKLVEHTGMFRLWHVTTSNISIAFHACIMYCLSGQVFAVDVTSDGRVLVSADYRGLVVATDLTTKTMLWSKQTDAAVYTLRIHNNAVFVPVRGLHITVLDVMTGDVLRRYPVLSGSTVGLVVVAGELCMWSLPLCEEVRW